MPFVHKKNCLSSLDGYIQNDNYNSAILIPGDEAELMLTFLAGQDYRLIVCSHPVLGEVAYEINDASGKRLFDSRKNEPDVNHVDFKVETTQQLQISRAGAREQVSHHARRLRHGAGGIQELIPSTSEHENGRSMRPFSLCLVVRVLLHHQLRRRSATVASTTSR